MHNYFLFFEKYVNIDLLGEIMRIVNLASGSKGNCTFICYERTKILLDAGLTEKNIKERLSEIGEKLEDISGVVVTHEHIDHIRAIKALAKKYDIDFYIREKLADSDAMKEINFKEGKLHKISDKLFNVGDLEILPVGVSHDAVDPVAYVINVYGSTARVGFITDLGFVSDQIKKEFSGIKMAFLESNYDEQMLFSGKYPYLVKQRIAGTKGHLSNEQSLEFAKFLFASGTKCFILSHLSENNNTPELAFANYADFFAGEGFVLDKDVFIRLSFQERHGNNFSLKEEWNGE